MNNLNSNKEKLLVCLEDKLILDYLSNSIKTYLGKIIDIIPVLSSQILYLDFIPDVVVASHKTIDIVKECFPNAKIILQSRDLSGQALENVVALPANANALVVNQHMAAAQETVKSLSELGIDHIKMTPYAPHNDIDLSNIDAVIYTGVLEDCPKINAPYINIGLRKISLYTIIDILYAFKLPSEFAKPYYNETMQFLTTSCYEISNTLHQVRTLKNNFEKICDINNNITFVLNNKNEIVLFNETAKKYFKIQNVEDIIGLNYQIVFKKYPELISQIKSGNLLTDTLITLENQNLLISSFDMDIENNQNKAFILLPLSTLQKREAMVRRKLNYTGFVAKYTFDDILGSSTQMNNTKTLANVYAQTEYPILITGESGTGKELFAQAIHNISSRKESNFVAINFAALPENLVESELFGYMEGAFTGASRNGKAGMFELAHQGTIFLDEIGEASLAVQAKLLRVLEEKEVIRVGGTNVIPVDVRIICATNKNLKEAIKNGTFREDLYHRIKVLNLQLKPLRERPNDIMDTISSMLSGNQALAMVNLPHIKNALIRYTWPGNARELRTVAEYINMLSQLPNSEESLDMLNVYVESNLISENDYSASNSTPPQISENNVNNIYKDQDQAIYISPDLRAILEAIYNLQNCGVIAGRNSICKTPAAQKMNLTESKIKSRLKKLEAMGCIMVGKTKQGAVLTDKGYNIVMQHLT